MTNFNISARLLGYSLLAAACFSSYCFAYNPPIGIPDPDWSDGTDTLHPIDTIAPDTAIQCPQWPANTSPNCYYVDKSIGDNANGNGSPDNPRETFPEGTHNAGTYIELHNGPYNGGSQIVFRANGTAANPVWVRGVDSDNRALITGEMIPAGQYLFMENLEFTTEKKTLALRNYNVGGVDSELHHAVIRDSYFRGCGCTTDTTSVISVRGSASSRFHDIVIYNNEISYFGISDGFTEIDYNGVKSSGYADYVYILENHIHNMGGDSVLIGKASTPTEARVSHVYVGRNHFHDNGENAVDIKESDFSVISENVMYGFKNTPSSAGEVVVAHQTAANILIINNTIFDGAYGILVSSSSDVWAIGNIIVDMKHDATIIPRTYDPASAYSLGTGIHFRSTTNSGMLNNTIIGYDTGIQLGTGSDYTIINNVITERRLLTDGGDPAGEIDINYSNSTLLTTSSNANNLLYNASGSTYAVSGTIYPISTLSDCIDCTVGFDPLLITELQQFDYVDLAGNSQSTSQTLLTSVSNTSPAVNRGFDIGTIIDGLENSFRPDNCIPLSDCDSIDVLTPLLDLFGNNRVMGPAIDLGAYETTGTTPSIANKPNKPTGVQVHTH